MKKYLLIVLFLIALFLGSCGGLPIDKSGGLSETAWTLVSYNGDSLISGSSMTAFFEAGEVNGSASCNHYFGSYKTKGNQIQIEGLGWTEMACMDPEGIMQQEQQLMSLFSQAATYSIQGQVLQITTDAGKKLIFQQAEVSD
ncbi:MAG: META domain-containing protein [Anaerolineales bacterium]|nr:META domain-containing protein [Anaerolineales bacterium]